MTWYRKSIKVNLDEHSNHLSKQYEHLWKHLEYHDSNIFKIMSIYFAFSGLLVARIELFKDVVPLASLLVCIAGLVFALLLYRTSTLLQKMKETIVEIDEKKYELHGYYLLNSIPEIYIESKIRASVVSCAAIIVLSLSITIYMFFYL